MPLDKILSDTLIKRKAIIAAPTICRFCNTKFLDKWYKGDRIHKVICERCGLVNAEVDMDDWLKMYYQGIRHSIGTYGDLGFHVEGIGFKKVIKAAYDFKTDAEVDQKLAEFEFGVKLKQRIAKKKEPKITIKKKGEPEYQMGQTKQQTK